MFGSNDDKKTPAAAGEKKGLFGWLRKKPQQPVVEQPETPVPEALEPIAPTLPEPVAVEPAPVASAPVAVEDHPSSLVLPVPEEPVALVADLEPHVPQIGRASCRERV